MHLLIPFAGCDDPACQQLQQDLRLPNLHDLLQRFVPETVTLSSDAVALPHEQALAVELGLDPLAPPWAALRAHELGLPGAIGRGWAFVHPCHWVLGQSQVILGDPQALELDETESRAFMQAMQTYFAEDGLTLHFDQPARWLVQGAGLEALACASPERVIGRDVAAWLPTSAALRRLQNEMQMLLYTHELNEMRAQRRATAINSFWLSGSGSLGAPPPSFPDKLLMPTDLMQAAVRADWPAWAAAWQRIDDEELAGLHTALETGATHLRLTLCGEARAVRYVNAPRSGWARLKRALAPVKVSEILGRL